MGGMCECWRHTAMYLTYWLCVKSHPLNMAARCVALVIYSRASTLTLPCCSRECLINAISIGSFFCQGAYPQQSLIQCSIVWENAGLLYITHLWKKKTLNQLRFFVLLCVFYCSGQRTWSRISMQLKGQDANCVLKMSQVWTQLVTFVECHILSAFESFWLFFDCVLQLQKRTNAIKMYACRR